MRNYVVLSFIVKLLITGTAMANLSIYDIQYTTDPAGNSPQMNNLVDCSGGIVIHKFPGYRTRLFLYDPAASNGWGAITAKDLTGSGAFDNINVGDWVSFSNTLVEEYKGNTQLAYDQNASLTIKNSGNTVPSPLLVDPVEFAISQTQRPAEKYEAMYVKVADVTVGARDLGKAGDNYELIAQNGTLWASDYMNNDAGAPYHPSINTGRHLESLSGIVEQYTSQPWDYYQILTLSNSDIVIPEPGTFSLFFAGLAGLIKGRSQNKK